MKVLNLRCAHGHGFEGWFGSVEDFESQLSRQLVECPLCGDKAVVRVPSAPRLNLGVGRDAPQPAAASAAADASGPADGRWLRAVREMLARTEDVGERFAEEARRMHYGETEERGIRGEATREQTEALLDEGIAVLPLLLPAALKQSLQ